MTFAQTATTSKEIGAHALSRAVRFADAASRYTEAGPGVAQQHAEIVALYSGLATVYADIAKAAASLTTTRNDHGK